MALGPDDTVCFCFHVTLRKIENFCKLERPQHASQISECLSAGTGCGWCVPLLKKIHERCCGEDIPWWRKVGEEGKVVDTNAYVEELDASSFQVQRKRYLAEGKGTPPAGAEG